MEAKERFLNNLEKYLSGIPSETRINLLSTTLVELEQNPQLIQENCLDYANKLRSRHHFLPYKKKSSGGIWRVLLGLFLLFWFFVFSSIGVFVWKFTPIMKVDEENQRVVFLGGLIDIDGKSGKVKIMDEVQFAQDNNFSDSFAMNMALSSDVDEIDISFNSGQFTLKNSLSRELKFNCKLAEPFDQKMMEQDKEMIKVDFRELTGVTCEIEVPEGKRILLEGSDSAINIDKPLFNLYIEIQNGHVAILPQPEHDYLFDLEVQQGYVGDFKSADSEDATEVQVRINNGSIVTK